MYSTAGNYGSGKRAGGVSTLICAVFDDRRVYEDDEDPKYNIHFYLSGMN